MAMRNLFGDLALDVTLQNVFTGIQSLYTALTTGTLRVASPGMEKVLVGTSQARLRDDFIEFNVNKWEVLQTGEGQTVTSEGETTRYLNITTGVVPGAETVLLSKDSFTPPFKMGVAITLSQRIANQSFFIEVVGVDANGVVEESSVFPSVETKNAKNCASFKFTGTSVTGSNPVVRADGGPELYGSLNVNTTNATGTAPNFNPSGLVELTVDSEEVNFGSRQIDSTGIAGTSVLKRTQVVPDPDKRYKIRIRVLNGGSAPASSTSFRLHFLRLLDTTRFTVDMMRTQGRADASLSIPVQVTGGALGTFQSVDLAAVLVSRGTETTAAILAANGVQTGTTRRAVGRANSSASYPIFAVDCFSPTDGTLKTQGSTDGTTWWDTQILAVVAGQPVQIVRRSVWEYNRAVFTNGAVAMTAGNPLRLGTSMQNN